MKKLIGLIDEVVNLLLCENIDVVDLCLLYGVVLLIFFIKFRNN